MSGVTQIINDDGSIKIDPTSGTGNVTISTSGEMIAVNIRPSYQSQMMNYITGPDASDTFVFIGDSITKGLYFNAEGQPGAADYRWANRLSNYYGKKEINLAVGGNTYSDQLPIFYNKWKITEKPACPYFVTLGINDIAVTDIPQQDAILTNALATAIYATLPTRCFKYIRSDSTEIKTTGIWRNNTFFSNFGMGCLSDGKNNSGTLETTVNGRYIVINSMCRFTDQNLMNIYIDGEKVDICRVAKRINGYKAPIDFKCWIYDSGSAGEHIIKIEAQISIYSTVFVDFVAAFDIGSDIMSDANPVIMPPVYNIVDLMGDKHKEYTTRKTYNEGLKQMTRMLRNVYKLPIYYAEDTTDTYNMYGNITSTGLAINLPMDGVHPGRNGHKWIFERMVNFLENGEYVYRNTM